MKIIAEEFRALLQRGKLTGSAAAKIAGVNPRTIRLWIGGDSEIPYSAWALIDAHVDQEAMIAEAQADHAAWIEAQDAPLPTLAERIAFMRAMQQTQHHAVCVLENDLESARKALAETTHTLNALFFERGKTETE